MQVFAEHARKQFEVSMLHDLRKRFPVETTAVSDEQLAKRIRNGTEKAKCYGLNLTHQVRAYLELDLVYGADFDVSPATAWAGKILRNYRITADAKLQALEDHQLFAG